MEEALQSQSLILKLTTKQFRTLGFGEKGWDGKTENRVLGTKW